MEGNMWIFATLGLLLCWMMPVDSMAVPMGVAAKKVEEEIPLSMVEDSVDDMYLGCNDKMMTKVKDKFLKEEKAVNSFEIYWRAGESCAKDKFPCFNAERPRDLVGRQQLETWRASPNSSERVRLRGELALNKRAVQKTGTWRLAAVEQIAVQQSFLWTLASRSLPRRSVQSLASRLLFRLAASPFPFSRRSRWCESAGRGPRDWLLPAQPSRGLRGLASGCLKRGAGTFTGSAGRTEKVKLRGGRANGKQGSGRIDEEATVRRGSTGSSAARRFAVRLPDADRRGQCASESDTLRTIGRRTPSLQLLSADQIPGSLSIETRCA
ncbi:hypothetical protein NQZ68_024608 [Dissostichus eleginoides]|nr:hypothetical protein NQZ68_024608 [Dissostichus eleginoides]